MTSSDARRRMLEAMLRNDFRAFALKVLHTLDSGEILYNWHQDALAHALDQVRLGQTRRLIINLPPRMAKSVYVLALCAFIHGHDPTKKIASLSYAGSLAAKLTRDYRRILTSDWYQALFPATRISRSKNSEDEIELTAGGYRLSWTIGGAITGRGADIIIVDDPIKAEDAFSDAIRSSVNDTFDSTILSRFDAKKTGALIVVMQRFHPEDLSGHLLAKGGWSHFSLAAIAEADESIPIGGGALYHRAAGEALHPARENLAMLEQQRADITSMRFAAQYQQSPIPLEGNLIKWAWFDRFDVAPAGAIIQSWDTAADVGATNAYTVCHTFVRVGHQHYLIDVLRERMDYPTLKRRVLSHAQAFRAGVVLIEYAALGMALVQDFRKDPYAALNIISVHPERDKVTRMAACADLIEARRVALPKHADWLDAFRAELAQFPHGKYMDQIDALSQYLNWVKLHPPITPDIPGLESVQIFTPDDFAGGYGEYGYDTRTLYE